MTAQLPSRERLEKIASWRETYGAGHNVMLPAEEAGALARFALATHEQEPVGIVHGVAQTLDGSSFVAMVECKTRLSDGTELFSHPAPVPAVHLSPDTEYMDEDAECLAMNLDKHNVPKEKGGQELSLWGRVVELCSQQAPVPAVPECFERLLAHAQGIAMGVDWNKGTAATHHRDKLCQAVKDCAAMLNGGKS